MQFQQAERQTVHREFLIPSALECVREEVERSHTGVQGITPPGIFFETDTSVAAFHTCKIESLKGNKFGLHLAF